MTNRKISELGAAAALGGGELLAGVQAGGNVAVTPAQLASYVRGGLPVAPKGYAGAATPGPGNDAAEGYGAGSRWLQIGSGVSWTCLDATAGAAQWAAEGALDHPGYSSGVSYTPAVQSTLLSTAIVAERLYAVPIQIGQRCTVASLGVRIDNGVAGTVRLAIYDNAAGPAAKVAEATTPASTGTAATLAVALAANTTLLPGVYWLAALFSASSSLFCIRGNERGLLPLIGGNMSVATTSGTSGVYASGSTPYAAGLPASFGAYGRLANEVAPFIAITIA